MMIVKMVGLIVLVIVLVSCGNSTPVITPVITQVPTVPPTPTETPMPPDVPVYRNSFEGLTDLAGSGITSSSVISLDTENYNYPGPGTALKVSGILPDEEYPGLEINFSISDLIGEDSLDLSNKVLGISFYNPVDSPLETFSVLIREGEQVVILGVTNLTGWFDYQLDIKSIIETKSWVYTNVSDTETMEIIRRCKELTFVGGKSEAASVGVEAEFSIDDLSWIGINDINHIPVNDNVDSLRRLAADQHFIFGLWTDFGRILGWGDKPKDLWYAYETVQEGSLNDTLFFPVLEEDDLTSIAVDQEDTTHLLLYNFGNGNNLTTMGYALGGWYGETVPQWIQDLSYPDEAQAVLLHSIDKDLSYTRGQHPIWRLFNEPVQGYDAYIPHAANTYPIGLNNRQNTDPPWMRGCCYSPWAENLNDSSLIEAAFTKADEVDPEAILIFTGISNEVIGWPLADYWFELTSGMKARGIPIDGIGMETHNFITPDGRVRFWISSPLDDLRYQYLSMDEYLKRLDENVKRYASVGMGVAFTEVDGFIQIDDIDFTDPDDRAEYESRLQWQAKYYAGLMKIAMENENVIAYRIFQITDKYGIDTGPIDPGYGNSGIFDKNYNPKPSYYAMMEQLRNP